MKIKHPKIISVSSSPTSSITTHSLLSSTDSSPSSSSSYSSSSSTSYSTPSTSSSSSPQITRCQGLNLLVKAIHQVTAGSVVGVPYIQKRVVIRRSRRSEALSFTNNENMLILTELLKKGKAKGKKKGKKLEENEAANELLLKQRRIMALPVKYQDSVLERLKPKTRNGRRDLSRLAMK